MEHMASKWEIALHSARKIPAYQFHWLMKKGNLFNKFKRSHILFAHVNAIFCAKFDLICRCPIDPQIITKFHTNSDGTQATAILKSMFKFPEGKILIILLCSIISFLLNSRFDRGPALFYGVCLVGIFNVHFFFLDNRFRSSFTMWRCSM